MPLDLAGHPPNPRDALNKLLANVKRVEASGRRAGPVPPAPGDRLFGMQPEPIPLDEDEAAGDQIDADIAALDRTLDDLDRQAQ